MRLITHQESNNLIGDSKHGFRNKRSSLTSLLDFFTHVIDIHDKENNKVVKLTYLNFKISFDKVPHERLLAHVIQGNAARWIRQVTKTVVLNIFYSMTT